MIDSVEIFLSKNRKHKTTANKRVF